MTLPTVGAVAETRRRTAGIATSRSTSRVRTLKDWDPGFELTQESLPLVYEFMRDYLELGYEAIAAGAEADAKGGKPTYDVLARLGEVSQRVLVMTSDTDTSRRRTTARSSARAIRAATSSRAIIRCSRRRAPPNTRRCWCRSRAARWAAPPAVNAALSRADLFGRNRAAAAGRSTHDGSGPSTRRRCGPVRRAPRARESSHRQQLLARHRRARTRTTVSARPSAAARRIAGLQRRAARVEPALHAALHAPR